MCEFSDSGIHSAVDLVTKGVYMAKGTSKTYFTFAEDARCFRCEDKFYEMRYDSRCFVYLFYFHTEDRFGILVSVRPITQLQSRIRLS